MTQTLTLELSPAAVANLERFAAALGRTAAEQAAILVEARYGRADPRTEAEKEAARGRFRRHFGAVSVPVPPGDHNEVIDEALGREYADSHEG